MIYPSPFYPSACVYDLSFSILPARVYMIYPSPFYPSACIWSILLHFTRPRVYELSFSILPVRVCIWSILLHFTRPHVYMIYPSPFYPSACTLVLKCMNVVWISWVYKQEVVVLGVYGVLLTYMLKRAWHTCVVYVNDVLFIWPLAVLSIVYCCSGAKMTK